MLIFVHLSVCSFVCSFIHKCLSGALNLHLVGSDLLQEHSESIKGALREH